MTNLESLWPLLAKLNTGEISERLCVHTESRQTTDSKNKSKGQCCGIVAKPTICPLATYMVTAVKSPSYPTSYPASCSWTEKSNRGCSKRLVRFYRCGRCGKSSCLPISDCPSSGCCSHLMYKLIDRRSLPILPLPLCLSQDFRQVNKALKNTTTTNISIGSVWKIKEV